MSNKSTFHKQSKQYVTLHGLFGSYELGDSQFSIKYFSTYANNRSKNSGPYSLLKELKPMRERVKPNEIRDISSLLQRDLNDARVANELVPYLLKMQSGEVAFFPAILAVLIPKGFIQGDGTSYPSGKVEVTDHLDKIVYGGKWISEVVKDEGESTSLGYLKIDISTTDIVVLDGQHRSNAFRVVTRTFDEMDGSIYEPFYTGIDVPEVFDADLPVTLVWFDSREEGIVNPSLISRKLFVDVNNTAKSVSESRTILLNDLEPSSILTRFFYSATAKEQSFNEENFSLLHSGFDIDSDLSRSSGNIMTISTPQILHYCFDWVFFGRRTFNKIDKYEIKRESSRQDKTQCESLVPNFSQYVITDNKPGNDNDYVKLFIGTSVMPKLEDEFLNTVYPAFKTILNKFPLLIPHYAACKEMGDNRTNKWGSSVKKEVWDKVFCGGEGLYYSFKSIPKKDINAQAKDLIDGIAEIEEEFSQARFDHFEGLEKKRVNESFTSFRSKAFQVGLFMAAFDYFEAIDPNQELNYEEKSLRFIHILSKRSLEAWVHIFTTFREALINGTDPKKWPSYHKIILRIISIDEDQLFFNKEDCWSYSPEIILLKKSINAKLESWLEYNDLEIDGIEFEDVQSEISGWSHTSIEYIEEIYSLCEIQGLLVDSNSAEEISRNEIKTILSKS